MPDGRLPFSGGSGPTWNDAMLAAEIRRRQQDGAPPQPTRSPARGRKRRRQFKAVCWALAAVAFLIGGVVDVAIGRASTSVVPFAVALVAVGWARHHLTSARSVG